MNRNYINRLSILAFALFLSPISFGGVITTEAEIIVGNDGNLLVTYTDGSAETFFDGGAKDLDGKKNGSIRLNVGSKKIKSYIRKFAGKNTVFKLVSTNLTPFEDLFDQELNIPIFTSSTSLYVEVDLELLSMQPFNMFGLDFNVAGGTSPELLFLEFFDMSSLPSELSELAILDQHVFDSLPGYTGVVQATSSDSFTNVSEPSSGFILISGLIILLLSYFKSNG